MQKAKLGNFIIVPIVLFFLGLNYAYGLDDGFGQAKKIKGEHFIIYYAPQLDLFSLAQQLNVTATDRMLVGSPFDANADLADMLDTLFLRTCDILDMHLYSFQGTIKICRDYNHLNQVYNNIFNNELGGIHSFYVYSLNTVYTCADNFMRGIIGHEIAHSIISHYFVVQPPVKVAEVLAGYVEYQLRKTGK